MFIRSVWLGLLLVTTASLYPYTIRLSNKTDGVVHIMVELSLFDKREIMLQPDVAGQPLKTIDYPNGQGVSIIRAIGVTGSFKGRQTSMIPWATTDGAQAVAFAGLYWGNFNVIVQEHIRSYDKKKCFMIWDGSDMMTGIQKSDCGK